MFRRISENFLDMGRRKGTKRLAKRTTGQTSTAGRAAGPSTSRGTSAANVDSGRQTRARRRAIEELIATSSTSSRNTEAESTNAPNVNTEENGDENNEMNVEMAEPVDRPGPVVNPGELNSNARDSSVNINTTRAVVITCVSSLLPSNVSLSLPEPVYVTASNRAIGSSTSRVMGGASSAGHVASSGGPGVTFSVGQGQGMLSVAGTATGMPGLVDSSANMGLGTLPISMHAASATAGYDTMARVIANSSVGITNVGGAITGPIGASSGQGSISAGSYGVTPGLGVDGYTLPLVRGGSTGTTSSGLPSIDTRLLNSSLPSNPLNPLVSICSELGEDLPQALKMKIINSEYVEFGTILDKSENMGTDQKEFSLSVQEGGTIVWKDNKPKRHITTIHVWTSAFLVFAAVFLRAHPSRTQELLKYCQIVRTAAMRHVGFGWRNYDIKFRMRQHLNPHRSWAVIDGELWSIYVSGSPSFQSFQSSQSFRMGNGADKGTRGAVRNFRTQGASVQAAGQPRSESQAAMWRRIIANRLCYDFNSSGCSRPQCKFAHKCSKCNESGHGVQKCKQTSKP